MDQRKIEQVVNKVLAVLADTTTADLAKDKIPVGVSNRHIHLTSGHVECLFGPGYQLTKAKDLKQVGEFAANETVTLVGPKGVLRGVRVLGPVRRQSQVEISRTDSFLLGVKAPVRDSGKTAGTPGISVVGPAGAITLENGVICAARHVHMQTEEASHFGLKDGDRVKLASDGERGCIFSNVLLRVGPDFRREFHIDTDEANAAGLNNGDLVTLQQ
ncbi:phosphate propanoyltransferase [Lucifera butyrica]|uniref:Phosphate propanoyltransferase n=1 Tax=Lucifera butyrica TaxID=1351585 RepID=A0A498R538_9FIRM|nr:phosphate propanoyltransferase [Lucifera butyrica]VBB05303.1 phosphate propanoyltransferase [Lucifera butyrica]